MRRVASGLLFLFFILCPREGSAQEFSDIIKDVSSISFYMSCWSARGQVQRNDCWSKAVDYGVDATYQVTKIPLPWSANKTIEGGWKPTRKEIVDRNGRKDTTEIYEPVEDSMSMSSFLQIDVGLGYSEFSGFSAVDNTFEIRGAVRELPAVSVFGTVSSDTEHSPFRKLLIRVGIRSGLIQLNDVQAIDPVGDGNGDVYFGTGQTFQLGGVAGVAVAWKKEIYPYVEYMWMRRKFQSVQWTFTDENHTVPERFPRELNFSGPSLSVGIRIQLK
jgi:hypothetical protein